MKANPHRIKSVKNQPVTDLFQISLKWIINVLILYIILVLVLGLGKTLFSIKDLIFGQQFSLEFSHVITDVLSFLVILELFRSFIEYFKAKRFRLHSMVDPFIIFVVRECLVMLYTQHNVVWQSMLGFAALILSLGIVRTLAVVFSPKDMEETDTLGRPREKCGLPEYGQGFLSPPGPGPDTFKRFSAP